MSAHTPGPCRATARKPCEFVNGRCRWCNDPHESWEAHHDREERANEPRREGHGVRCGCGRPKARNVVECRWCIAGIPPRKHRAALAKVRP